jgi:hypothetical protein
MKFHAIPAPLCAALLALSATQSFGADIPRQQLPDPMPPAKPPTLSHDRPGDLFPKVPPIYVAPNSASREEVLAPLASAHEEQSFHSAYDAILQDAEKGSDEDKSSTAELLRRRTSGKSAGEKRLLLVAAFNLLKQANATPADMKTLATSTLEALDGNSLPLASNRIAILADMHRILPHDERYGPAAIADEILALCEMCFNAGMVADADRDLDIATQWAALDPAYAARMKPRINAFKATLQRQSGLETKLAADPNDPEANTAKGLAILSEPRNLRDAAPYLAKSSKPELRALAKAISTDKPPLEARIEISTAAADALNVTAGEDQQPIANLLFTTARDIVADRKATEAQKARAELLMIKAEKLVGKEKADEAAAPPRRRLIRFFDVSTDARRVVYILDHSGSMLDNFDFLRQEAVRSIGDLEETQSFGVVMVSEQATAIYPKLQPASAAQKKELRLKLAQFRAQGSNDDLLAPFLEAFQKAFAMHPDAIYFLTDGHFDPRLPKELQKLNAGKAVRINTLAFINKEPGYEQQLRQMAKDNGGSYKFVSERDLGK